MPRTRTPTVVSIILAFGAIIFIGVRQVQSPPVSLSEEKLKPRSVGCAPYTHWDTSSETCVSCSPEDCLPGEELREDCGYNEEGHPVANCRPCPNGTYSATGGQKQCQFCKTCLSGYEQECNSKQPAVCLCADDEELAPDGTTCQKTCCLCLDSPNPSDIINECFQRYPGTDYHCKNSWSTGNTCTRPPEPTTTTVSPTTTPQQTTVRNVSVPTPDTTNPSEAPPTFPASSTPSNSPSEPTTNHIGTPKPLPIHKGKQQLSWFVDVIIAVAGCLLVGIICLLIRAHLFKTSTDVGFDKLIGAESDGEEGGNGGGGDRGEEEDEGGLLESTKDADPEDQDEEVNNSDGADSGNVSNESSDAGSDKRDSQCSSKDSLLDMEGGQEEDSTQEGESTDSGDRETLDNKNEKTVPKEVGSEDSTMGFVGRFEGPPNDGKGLDAVPTGGGPNRPNQQQPGGQNGQPAVNISGGTFNAPVTIVVQGNNSHYNAGQGMDGQGQGTPGNGNGRVGNRRRQNIRVNILPNPARLGQNVRFSCTLPDNLDPGTCEFRWTKQVDCVAHVQNWNRAVQHCDVGVYTCEVTTPGGEVLDGQAELVIIEDDAAGGVDLPGPSRRPRDNDSDGHNTPRKRPRTAGPGTSGAQGFSSGQIQGIHQLPLEEILNEEDLFSDLRVKLENSDRHYRNIGSHFGLTHEELDFLEFTELRGKDSPLRAILQKVTQSNENITVGELLQYCEKLKRIDVIKTVVDYFVEKEQQNQETAMEAKQDVEETSVHVVAGDSQRIEECRRDSIDNYVPEETLPDPSVALENLGACDTETFELKEMS